MVLVTAHPFWWPISKNQAIRLQYYACSSVHWNWGIPPDVISKRRPGSVWPVDLYSVLKGFEFIQSICKTSFFMSWHFVWAQSPTVWCPILLGRLHPQRPNTGPHPLGFLYCLDTHGNKVKTYFFPPRKFFIADTMKVKKSIDLLNTTLHQKPQILTSIS